jgi:hypothetical protein
MRHILQSRIVEVVGLVVLIAFFATFVFVVQWSIDSAQDRREFELKLQRASICVDGLETRTQEAIDQCFINVGLRGEAPEIPEEAP